MPRTNFDPATHGFYFSNRFRNYFSPGIVTRGRCGGMAYGALDFYNSGQSTPRPSRAAVSGMDLSSRAAERMDLFARSETDASVLHRSFYRNGWSDWGSLGGQVTSDPSAVSWSEGQISVFARGVDNALWHRSWKEGAWTGWETLGGVLHGAPDAASWGPGRLDVFARGADDALWHRPFDNGRWGDWGSLGGRLTSDPAAVSWGVGRIDVFARGVENALWHRAYQGGWSDWGSIGGELTSAPDVCSWEPGRLDVFARGTDNALWRRSYAGGWKDWESLGGVITGNPAAVSPQPGRIDVAALGTDGEVYRLTHQNNGWSGWVALSTDLPADGTPLESFLYRRQITSLVNQGPGFVGRLLPHQSDRERFNWGVQERDELGKLRRHIDAGRPMPVGLISVRSGIDVHHQAVAIGYDNGAGVASLRIHIYDPNFPGEVVTLAPRPDQNCFSSANANGSDLGVEWRTYFVDEAYRAVQPYH